ncbi:MAG TPA: arsenate reductase ArsC [candidate division Zixibacteria bacterium]|nr:arsenate reductase ArsC [candidate division Zixibacteria bacterium]
MDKTKVIFLCTGNSARSQMAEALLRKYAGEHFEVYSAGFDPQPINPLTVKVMNEIGLDLSSQYSKGLKQFLGKTHFGIVITVCADAEEKCPTMPGVSTRLYWPFEDPAKGLGTEEEKLAKFREVRDQINAKIKTWLKERGIPEKDSDSQQTNR